MTDVREPAAAAPSRPSVLRAVRLVKRFAPGGRDVVADVSIGVEPGEIVGVLGPNGAGKSTIIGMLVGVIRPTSGLVEVAGFDLERHRASALARLNFAGSHVQLPGNLTVEQNLRVFGLMYGLRPGAAVIEEVIERFDLKWLRREKTGVLSTGEQARVGLAKAMLNDPVLLLLDEPTGALDPAAAREVRSHILGVVRARRCGVLWTSHNMAEVEEVCERVVLLSRGRIVLAGDPRTLPWEHGHASLEDLFVAVAQEPFRGDSA